LRLIFPDAVRNCFQANSYIFIFEYFEGIGCRRRGEGEGRWRGRERRTMRGEMLVCCGV